MGVKIPKWGPPKLRDILEAIEKAINERTPLPGFGIDTEQQTDGTRIMAHSPAITPGGEGDGSGAGAGGSNVNLYGANDGAPFLFHLKQSSPPTPVP